MSSWPFLSCLPLVLNVLISPFTGSGVCVCVCECLWISFCFCVCALWQCPWFCMKFHHAVYTLKPSNTHLERLAHRVKPLVVSVQGYRFANKRSNVSMGWVSVVGLFKSFSPLQTEAAVAASEPLLTTDWRPQQTSVAGCVGTSWITVCCQASWW